MLAYVFWHRSDPNGDASGYERALTDFQKSLLDASPAGFLGCAAYAVDGAPWLRGQVYEDWYLVDDWAALGALNEAAVDSRRRVAHDAVATAARGGVGGVYLRRAGSESLEAAGPALWLDKPAGIPYGAFRDRLTRLAAEDGCVWERQLVLGPAPEYCAVTSAGAAAAPVAATVVQRRSIFSAPA